MTSPTPTSALELPDEEAPAAAAADAYRALLERLSHQSVAKHYDAYADVPWDDPAFAVDPADPRFELTALDPLGATAWYRALPQTARARLGLEMIVGFAKTGLQFENVLQRGLLEFAFTLPNGAPEYRYALHEVIEEGQHSLMFQELVNRSGLDLPGLPPLVRFGSRQVVRLARTFPELFFLFVLGGEDPIDFLQREHLRTGQLVHPLLRRIAQIHVTEEARHLSFARAWLRRRVPELGAAKRTLLRVRTPMLFGGMSRMMLEPGRATIRRHAIPKAVLREAYRESERARALRRAALHKPRELCIELGIAAPPFDALWRRMGIWAEPA
jgi:hypothetical protein